MTKTVITTVTVSATLRDLTTLETVKDVLAVTGTVDDTFLSRTISQCSTAVEQGCNRVFALETLQDTVFLERDGYPHMVPGGLPALQLSRWPIVSVASVTEAGRSLTAGSDFIPDQANGRLIRLHIDGLPSRWRAAIVVVIYQAGYVLPGDTSGAARTLPCDVEDAVCRLVAARWAERRRDPYLKVEETAGIRNEYWIPAYDSALPPDVASLLDNYRVPVVS